MNKVRITRRATADETEPKESRAAVKVRLRLVHRPAERGEVDAAEPARRHEARDRVRQAADDEEPDSRRAELSGRAGRLPRHARHPSAAAPHERADGRRRASTRSARSTSSAWSWTSSEQPGKGDRFVLDLVKDVKAPVFLILNKIDLIKKSRLLPIDRAVSARMGTFAEIVPVSAATGDNVDRLERVHLERLPEGRAALSGRLPDRPAGAVLGRRDRPREAAAVHARRDPVLERGRRRPVRGAGGGRAGCCGCTARSSSTASRRSRS